MDTNALFSQWAIRPLAAFGLTNSFWNIHLDTVLFTWLSMGLLFFCVFLVRRYYFRPDNLVYTGVEMFIESFANMCADAVGYFRYDYFCFITTLFVFTFFCCVSSLIPFVEESTKDANTTFALSLASFFYVVYQQISHDGIIEFLKHFFLGHDEMPMVMRIGMSPIEVMGRMSKIISMGFRLFGNILGGAVVYHVLLGSLANCRVEFVWAAVIGGTLWIIAYRILRIGRDSRLGRYLNIFIELLFALTWLQLFFGVFEALIQSFVISMLSSTYLALAVKHELKNDPKGIVWNS
jgi:F-type H+-transporting ATPase subunit a